MIKSKALRITTLFAVAGLLILLLVAYVERSIMRNYNQNLPFVKLGEHVKTK
ncbi:MAG: hypothetical protein HC859_09020 [Bacteroidia bacterium]|nr:hypothetical protein [Bacteroidia bacterium]